MNQNKVIDLKDYKEKKQKEFEESLPKQDFLAFEPGQFYVYKELGLMVHVLFITDKSIAYDNLAIYVMDDQFGNLHAEIMDDDSTRGWSVLKREDYMKAFLKVRQPTSPIEPDDPEPPKAV